MLKRAKNFSVAILAVVSAIGQSGKCTDWDEELARRYAEGGLVRGACDVDGASLMKSVCEDLNRSCIGDGSLVVLRLENNLGIPSIKRIYTKNAQDSDIFYCEQALWELGPASSYTARVYEFKSEGLPLDTCPELSAKTSKGMVALHLIPANIRLEGSLVPNFIHSRQNVVQIPLSKVHDGSFQQFRQDWITFLMQNSYLTETEVREMATRMRNKYSDLFVKKTS